MAINIGATNADDAFYRYKMPKLLAKVEGRGNGIKTNIVNNVDIARALARSPEYTLKFFGCELGAQTNFDKNTGVSILNGAHDAKKLQDLLEGFIKRFVQCHSCGNPETIIKIKKEFIHLKCKACGFVSDVDMRHKLTTFIIKNPPENKLSKEEARLKQAEDERMKGAKASDKKEKKEKKEKKDKKKKGDDAGDAEEGVDAEASTLTMENSVEPDHSDASEDDVVWMTDTSAEAVQRRAEEQLTAATAAMVTQGNIEAERIEKERQAAELAAQEEERRKEQEAREAKAKVEEEARVAEAKRLADEEAAAEANAVSSEVSALRSCLANGHDADELGALLKGMTVEGGMAGKMRVLQEAVFAAPEASSEKLPSLLTKNKALFLPYAADAAGQLSQLVALEHFLAVAAPERGKEGALAIKAMYDLDLVDEEVIIAWYNKQDAGRLLGVPTEGAQSVRKAAAPLVQWFADNDSEDEDSDGEEEDD